MTFHPDHGNIFALAFGDGTLATYNASRLQLEIGRQSAHDGEIAHIKNLHISGTELSSGLSGYDRGSCGDSTAAAAAPVGDIRTGINAVVFVPGSECTTASVASGGRCYVVDFERNGLRSQATVYRSWHISAPATAISIVQSRPELLASQFDGSVRDHGRRMALEGLVVAIGGDDGGVLLYNLEGELLAQHEFGTCARIVDLEWRDAPKDQEPSRGRSPSIVREVFHGQSPTDDGNLPQVRDPSWVFEPIPTPPTDVLLVESGETSGTSPMGTSSNPSNGQQNGPRLLSEPEKEDLLKQELEKDPEGKVVVHDRAKSPNAYATPGASASEKSPRKNSTHSPSRAESTMKRSKPIDTPKMAGIPSLRPQSSLSSRSKRTTPIKKASRRRPPVIPPRPVPRQGGKLALRQAESARSKATNSSETGSSEIEDGKKNDRTGSRSLAPSTRERRFPRGTATGQGTPRPNSSPTKGTQNRAEPGRDVPDRVQSTAYRLESPKSTPETSSLASGADSKLPRQVTDARYGSQPPVTIPLEVEEDSPSITSYASTGTVVEWQTSIPSPKKSPFSNISKALQTSKPKLPPRPAYSPVRPRTPRNVEKYCPLLSPAEAAARSKQSQAQSDPSPPKRPNITAVIPSVSSSSDSPVQRSHVGPAYMSRVDQNHLPAIKAFFREEFAVLQRNVEAEFREQRRWLEGFVRKQEGWALRVEEENRLLREELAKGRKGGG